MTCAARRTEFPVAPAGNSREFRWPPGAEGGALVFPGGRQIAVHQALQVEPRRLGSGKDRVLQVGGQEGQAHQVAMAGIGRRRFYSEGLLTRGILEKAAAGGRSTSYSLVSAT